MVAVVCELPTTGYALEVDGRLKTEFETKEGAWKGAEELKKRFPDGRASCIALSSNVVQRHLSSLNVSYV
jgi:predicted Holliday junction resolvase-like endonuclease